MVCEIQHHHNFQCSNGTPVFTREECAEAKTTWAQQAVVDLG